jgi:long-chain acyl-CoA synthetase
MEKNVVSMVESRAKLFKERVVLKYKDQKTGEYLGISWFDFWEKAKAAAHSVLAYGHGKGANVGIFSENMPEWTISDIAIMAAQSVVVPIFGNASMDQVKFIVDHTEMRLLFVGNQNQIDIAHRALQNTTSLEMVVVFKSELVLPSDKFVYWDDFVKKDSEGNFAKELATCLENIQPSDLATILYTSGTTGDPKGVMLTHGNFTQCFNIHDHRLDITSEDISMSFLPLSHIFERAWSYYLIYKGATNVYLENPRTVIEEIKIVKPTVMCTVPRFFEKTFDGINHEVAKWSPVKQKIFKWSFAQGALYSDFKSKQNSIPLILKLKYGIAEKLVFNKFRKIFGGKIRAFPCSGAAISNHHLRFFHAAGIFINYGYGTTETTATVSCFNPKIYDLNSCGSIMPSVDVKISDEGEILVKGDTIFKGYYKNPEATQKAIVDGWYKTGDKGYVTESGDLVMTDRINDIFKTSGGKFVSPQKLELLLLNDAYIEQALAIGDNRKFVTALIIPSFINLRAQFNADEFNALSDEQLIKDPTVIDFYQQRIDNCMNELPQFERVVKFKLISEPFSIQNNGLTNTLKVRRKLISGMYNDFIEEMYLSS